MIRVRVGGHEFTAEAFVFDKDGLMFESQRFWQELGDERMAQMHSHGCGDFAPLWAEAFGLALNENGHTIYCDPKGILAVASPAEEIAATAALYVREKRVPWDEALRLARSIFAAADASFSLARALKPRPGFPDILRRLRDKGVPYGVASSDTAERVHLSLQLFDDPAAIRFCITPKDVERGKPAPDMVLKAAELLQVPAAELVVVGDSFVDAEMARQAGCRAIGVPETEDMGKRMADAGAYVIHSLEQIELF